MKQMHTRESLEAFRQSITLKCHFFLCDDKDKPIAIKAAPN
jgi:hypothetical protein